MKHAVAAGHICLDIIPQIDHHFDLIPGRLYEIGPATIATGGAVSNTGVALHILGVPVTLMGKIGDDAFGQSVRKVLADYGEGLDEGMILVPGETTSYTVVVCIPGIDRMYLHCPGANHSFGAEDVAQDRLAGNSLFHFGYPPYMRRMYENGGAEIEDMFRRVSEAGLTTSLDLGMPEPGGPSGKADWQGLFRRTMPFVDIFMPSADELLFVLDRANFGQGDNISGAVLARLSAQLLDLGVAVAGIKLGSRGLYLRTGSRERLLDMGDAKPADLGDWANRELWFPVYEISKFVGATGAGDTTIAGFLAAFLRGRSIEASGCFANAVGACNVQAPDALGGICSWEETMALLDAGWRQVDLGLADKGWRRHPGTGIWHGPNDAQA
jgi:sugar/nucleoside kinase (ribokinase family)